MPIRLDAAFRRLPDLLALGVALAVQWRIYRELLVCLPDRKKAVQFLLLLSVAWVVVGFLPYFLFPYWGVVPWLKAGGFGWAIVSTASMILWLAWTRLLGAGRFDSGRRQALQLVRTVTLAAPAAVLGYGVVVGRRDIQLREVEIPVRNLPKDLHNLKLVQVTDIHLGPFFEPRDLERAIAMANETRAQIALVTGDLVNARRDPLQQCLQILSRLKVDGPTLGCLGNHEIHAECEREATELGKRAGIDFLRFAARTLQFGGAKLNVAGVDYQRKFEPYLVGAETLTQPGMVNILLSHNPDVFPVAVSKGYDLTVAGHTHGGQITVEILGDSANFARFYTPYIYGRYERDGKNIYVSRGLGTVGVPARVGAPPEVSLIKLCAT
ncbi:MAG: metallophosphoesterase [Bryobacterales bacterium]|nr:metallophosphoesterase [Bryobacterales bacterium]